MRKLYLLLGLFFIQSAVQAQSWSDGVAELVYNECAYCHHPDGIAPFSLLDYQFVADNAASILEVVESGEMPPWTADETYQTYAHQRVLTEDEIQLMVDWVNGGTPEGNPDDAPPPPVFAEDGFITAEADLELQIPLYTSQATEFSDDYVCFSIPSGLLTDKKLRAFEVVPGNSTIVHHVLAYVDESGDYPTDTNGNCSGPTEGLLGGYTPGGFPTVYPSDGEDFNMGVTIPAGSNIVLAMHYPEGSLGEQDDTKIKLYFYDDAVDIREITTNPIIQNWNFTIPADAEMEIEASYGFIPNDQSILSVFPHMHLLGHSIQSYAVTLEDDTIPFVNIPHWDFEWQEFLFFEEIQVLPAWSTVYGKGEYDNTSNNPHNPNDPPIDVSAGLNTSDEMFLVYFHYLTYEEGDEDVNLQELTQLPNLVNETAVEAGQMTVYPNPATDQTHFSFNLSQSSKVSLYLYDAQGKLLSKVLDKEILKPGEQVIRCDVSTLPRGAVMYSMSINGSLSSGSLLLR